MKASEWTVMVVTDTRDNSRVYIAYIAHDDVDIAERDYFCFYPTLKQWNAIKYQSYEDSRCNTYNTCEVLSAGAADLFFEDKGYPESDQVKEEGYELFSNHNNIIAEMYNTPMGVTWILRDRKDMTLIMLLTGQGWATMDQNAYDDFQLEKWEKKVLLPMEITKLLDMYPMSQMKSIPQQQKVASLQHAAEQAEAKTSNDSLKQSHAFQSELRNLLKTAGQKYPLLKISDITFALDVEKQIIINNALQRSAINNPPSCNE